MTRTLAVYVGLLVATLAVHYGLYLNQRVYQMEMLVKLSGERERIQNDQVQELLSMTQHTNQRVESARTEGFVAGIVDGTNKPDHYQAVWHNGYDRGTAVQKDVESVMKVGPVSVETPKK